MSVTVIKDKVKAVLASLSAMEGKRVFVGIPEGKGARQEGEIGNAQLGYIQDHGSPANNIPPRPFLVPGVNAAESKIVKVLKTAAKNSADGDKSALDVGLNAAGLIAQASVKKAIVAGDGFAPLKPSTIKARERSGAKGTKPLIRTGQLLNSVNYVIKEK